MNLDNKPLVSIVCITYNHEKFVAQTIEGFLKQKTNFIFEILICEDKSTDGTAQIIKEYENRFPELFVTFYHKENMYSQGINFFQTEVYPAARGKYIAFCEGDDYWTDPLKLQKQVDYLEENPEYGMVYTAYRTLFEESGKFVRSKSLDKGLRDGFLFEQILSGLFIKTLTICFRREAINNFSILPKDIFAGDKFLCLEIAKCFKIKYLDFETGVYRVLNGSASHFDSYEVRYKFRQSVRKLDFYYLSKYTISNRVINKVLFRWEYDDYIHALICNDRIAYSNLKLWSYIDLKNIKELCIGLMYTICKISLVFKIMGIIYKRRFKKH